MDRMNSLGTIGFFGITSFIIFAVSFGVISNAFHSKTNTWEKTKRDIMTKVWPLILVGTVCLFITSAFFILQDPHNTMYVLLALCCLAVGLAYSTLIISILSR